MENRVRRFALGMLVFGRLSSPGADCPTGAEYRSSRSIPACSGRFGPGDAVSRCVFPSRFNSDRSFTRSAAPDSLFCGSGKSLERKAQNIGENSGENGGAHEEGCAKATAAAFDDGFPRRAD